MIDTQKKVVRVQENRVNELGDNVQQETTSVQKEAGSKTTASNVVWYVLGFIEALLALRFILRLFGANPSNGFVDGIYSVSGALSAPFDNIFGVTTTDAGQTTSVFEPSILVAAIVYALIAWGIVKLITINDR